MLREVQGTTVLPHGLWDESGVCHRWATFGVFTGAEELALAEGGVSAASVSRLLAATVRSVGALEPFSHAHADALSRGDRQHLALRLLSALRGDRISVVPRCPNPDCGALADLDLHISQLAPDVEAHSPEVIRVELPGGGTATLREPIGADDVLMERLGGGSPWLWPRLLLGVDGGSSSTWADFSSEDRQALALALAEQTTAPDLVMVAKCPECAAWMEVIVDPFALLHREVGRAADRLHAEVHTLAFHYHWSERDILALPRARRWKYLELVRRQLEGRPLTDVRVMT